MGTTAAGGLAGQPPRAAGQADSVRMGEAELPVILRSDVAVAGGSLSAVAAALALRASGRSVAIVEPRSYLGREIGAHLRPWLPAGQEVPPLLRSGATAPPVPCGTPTTSTRPGLPTASP